MNINNNNRQFVCLSGLPRSGSTLLSSILSQNPKIHAEGNSAVCQLMWDMYKSCNTNSIEQLQANNRFPDTMHDLISHIPKIYYNNISPTKEVIVDKCRSWTIEQNVHLLQKFINPSIKIIVIERSITDIIKSFVKLYKKNNVSNEKMQDALNKILTPNSEPIMRSIAGINWAKKYNNHIDNNNENNTFLFINYNDLIDSPEQTLKKIYDFCNWEKPIKNHTFHNIYNPSPENDTFYNINGFHHIRPTLQREMNEIILPLDIMEKCTTIDSLMGYRHIQ